MIWTCVISKSLYSMIFSAHPTSCSMLSEPIRVQRLNWAREQNRPRTQIDSMLKKQGRWVQNRMRTWWPKKMHVVLLDLITHIYICILPYIYNWFPLDIGLKFTQNAFITVKLVCLSKSWLKSKSKKKSRNRDSFFLSASHSPTFNSCPCYVSVTLPW